MQTEVSVLALIRQDAAVVNTVMVPNRIWKDMRTSGIRRRGVRRREDAASSSPARKTDSPRELWVVVPVKFARS